MPELLSGFGSVSTRPVYFYEVLLVLVELQEGVGLYFYMPHLDVCPWFPIKNELASNWRLFVQTAPRYQAYETLALWWSYQEACKCIEPRPRIHPKFAEVYTLSILFVALVLACLLAYDSTWRPAWLRAGLLIFAFSFAHATSQVLLIPGLLIYLAVRRPAWLFRPRELARLLPLGAALALLPYAYLVWRTTAGAPLLDTRVTGITSFWEVISGARYSGQMFAVPLRQIISERLPLLWSDGIQQFGVALLVCAVGLLMLIMQRPLAAAVTGLWVICTAVFVLAYATGDWETMLLPLWFLLGLWGVVGIDRCVGGLSSRARWAPMLVAITLPVAALASGYPEADRSSVDPQADVDAALKVVPDNSIIFTYDNGTRHQFWYRVLPGDLETSRNVWAAMGVNPHDRSDRVGQILQYCATSSGLWIWSDQEKAAGPGAPPNLKTYVYGSTYVKQVRISGLRVTRYSGQLFSVSCPS